MTEASFIHRPRAPKAAVASADIDELGMFGEPRGEPSMSSRRVGILLFWAAVACLLLARVALFDPAATRAVGSFADQIAPIHTSP